MSDEKQTTEQKQGEQVSDWPPGAKWKVQVNMGGIVKPLFEGPQDEAIRKFDERSETHNKGTLVLIDPDGKIREQKVRASFRPQVMEDGSVKFPEVDVVPETPERLFDTKNNEGSKPAERKQVRVQGGLVVARSGKDDAVEEAEEASAQLSDPKPEEGASSSDMLDKIERIDKAIGRLRTTIKVLEARREMFVRRLAAQNDIGPVRNVVAWAIEALKGTVR